MRYLIDFFNLLSYITTGIVFVFIVMCCIGGAKTITTASFWQIIAAAGATALVTVLLYPKTYKSTREYIVRIFIHYIALCAVMMGLASAFDWIDPDITGVIVILLTTAAVYGFSSFGTYISSKRQADELNEAITRKRRRG